MLEREKGMIEEDDDGQRADQPFVFTSFFFPKARMRTGMAEPNISHALTFLLSSASLEIQGESKVHFVELASVLPLCLSLFLSFSLYFPLIHAPYSSLQGQRYGVRDTRRAVSRTVGCCELAIIKFI